MKRMREDTKAASGSQVALAFQAISFVESSLQQIVSQASKKEGQGQASCVAAREQLVRASTLVEVLATFPAAEGVELSISALEDLLTSARKIVHFLLLLPQVQLQYSRPPETTPRSVVQLPRSISPQAPTESYTELGQDEVDTVEEEEGGRGDGTEEEEGVGAKFHDVVGNAAAKQALHENIVLPLTLPTGLRQQLLTGIRSGCGNVLLYGPVGAV